MQARRRLLMTPHGIDTSPKILAYGKYWWRGGLKDDADYCATVIMPFTPSTSVQWPVFSGLCTELDVFKDGQYVDYWGLAAPRLNANSNGVAVTLKESEIDDAYLYVKDSGEIIFAGKNTIYYGHRNISELN